MSGPQCATVLATGLVVRIGADTLPNCVAPDRCRQEARCFWRVFHELEHEVEPQQEDLFSV